MTTPIILLARDLVLITALSVLAGVGIEGWFTFRHQRRLERALTERNAEVLALKANLGKGIDHGD